MAACVEVWESDPEALHYHGSGYIALGSALAGERPDRGLRASAADRLPIRAVTSARSGHRPHARAVPGLARARDHRLPARARRRLRVQPRVDVRAGRQGARGRRRRSSTGVEVTGFESRRLGRGDRGADERRRDRGRAGGGGRRAVDRVAVVDAGAARPARCPPARRQRRRRSADVDVLVPPGGRDRGRSGDAS